MLSKKYLGSVKNFHDIMKRIIVESPPEKFTIEYLKSLGFKSSNDYRVIRFLKDIKFLSESGNPTHSYYEYRNPYRSRQILGQIVKDMYSDVFLLIEMPSTKNREFIKELFKSQHLVSDQIALFMTNTFFSLLEISDLSNSFNPDFGFGAGSSEFYSSESIEPKFRYNIELHLPSTNDKEIYNLIFKSLKEHLCIE
jgi:hypothetical protein